MRVRVLYTVPTSSAQQVRSCRKKDRIFGKRLVSSDDQTASGGSLVLHFKDDMTAEADAVIGADGIHSHVRDYILSPEGQKRYTPTHSGATAYRNLIPMEKAVEALGAEVSQNCYIWMLNQDKTMIMSYPVDHYQRLNVIGYTWQYTKRTRRDWVIPVSNEEVLALITVKMRPLPRCFRLVNSFSTPYVETH